MHIYLYFLSNEYRPTRPTKHTPSHTGLSPIVSQKTTKQLEKVCERRVELVMQGVLRRVRECASERQMRLSVSPCLRMAVCASERQIRRVCECDERERVFREFVCERVMSGVEWSGVE
jgi:hypothetical protein